MNKLAAYTQVDALSQDDLIVKYAPMVKRIAHHLLARLPRNVCVDDLFQSGMIGLLDASKNFDDTKGASFETYAGIRIRGMMLDDVRKNDWFPRSVYRNSRTISQAIPKVEARQQRDAKDHEVAEELELSIHDYHNLLRDTNTGHLYGYDDIGMHEDVMSESLHGGIEDPHDLIAKQDLKTYVVRCIDALPSREKLILSLYYDEEMNLKEIGEILGVSESRICQICSQALARIQSRIPAEVKQAER